MKPAKPKPGQRRKEGNRRGKLLSQHRAGCKEIEIAWAEWHGLQARLENGAGDTEAIEARMAELQDRIGAWQKAVEDIHEEIMRLSGKQARA